MGSVISSSMVLISNPKRPIIAIKAKAIREVFTRAKMIQEVKIKGYWRT